MKRFVIAVSIGLSAFALANLTSLFVRSDEADEQDYKDRWGFPVLVSEEYVWWDAQGKIPDPNAYFSRRALVADVAVFLMGSIAVTAASSLIRPSRAGSPTMSLHSTPR